jgi:outer membrane protein TolC
VINEALGMLESMAREITTKRKQLENYESKILPALRKNYQTTLLAYQENTGDLPLVIDAWEALNMAQMEYLNNLQLLLNMQVSYEKELEK